MMDFNPDTEYVLTAPRTRASWKVLMGNVLQTHSKRFKRGEVLKDIPEGQIARLVQMGHAVPKDEYDPEALKRVSAARRLAMNQAAAADAKAAVDAREAAAAAGQPVAGLEDARTSDGVKIEDVLDMEDADGTDDGDDLTSLPDPSAEGQPAEDYHNMPYPELQQYAKRVTGSGAGSADDIKARLDEHFAQ
jgi:hypothetical protein